MKVKLLLACVIFGVSSLFSHAQQTKTISGIITDTGGIPLPGAEIKVTDKSIFDVTDFEGNFTLEGVEEGDTFQVTFLGFKSQTVEVTSQTEYNISLEEDTGQLDEVVVVGYGRQRKQDLTGAISQVDSEEITKQPASTATQALQGKVAGVTIINSDQPGSTPTVAIRGLGTALGGRNPLYVVDGVPVNDISNISPSNIESMDFLKDASSAAIYGVRAANGVIIVTTKQGKTGKSRVNVRSFYGVKPLLNQVEMANASQYVTYFNEENAAIGSDNRLAADQPYDTNWYDELTQIGFINNTTMSVSGGGENIDYFFSADYFAEEGLLEDQKFQRTTITSNNTYKLFDDRLRFIQNLNIAVGQQNPKPLSAFDVAYRQAPIVPVFYPDGRYGGPYYNRNTGVATNVAGPDETIGNLTSHGNPVEAVDFFNQSINTFNIQGSFTAEFDITDDITFTSRYGARKNWFKSRNFNANLERYLVNGDPNNTLEEFQRLKTQNPENTAYAENSLTFSSSETYKYNWDNFINFNRSFGDHNLDVTLGGSKEQIGIGFEDNYTTYEVPEEEQYWGLNHASGNYENIVNQFNYTPTNFMSFFGRVQYNFNSKYYFTGTLRRDGSSTFQNNAEYWGTFPAVGLGWTLSNESFLENNDIINFLKLRGSYGELGNASVPFNTTQILTSPNTGNQNYVFGVDQNLVFGAYIGSPAQNLSWERVNEISVGVDYELLDYKLTGSIDYYRRKTENTILRVQPLLNSTYATDFFDHGAEVLNEGIEFAANWNDKVSEDFSYNIGMNFSYNKNEVQNVVNNYDGQLGGDLGFGGILTKRLAEGEPLGSWWMYETNGVWQNQNEIDNNPSLGPARPGHLRYVDQNDDGVIDDRDKIYQGTYLPVYNYGLNIGFNYKQFDFSLDGYGVGGNKIYNALKAMRLGGENVPLDLFENRWTGEGSTNSNPGAERDIEASDYYLEDGDFFRINNVTLGYTLPQFTESISKIRLYASAQNPVIFTDYSGFNPELNSNGDPYGTTGIERGAYPLTSTYLVGIDISL